MIAVTFGSMIVGLPSSAPYANLWYGAAQLGSAFGGFNSKEQSMGRYVRPRGTVVNLSTTGVFSGVYRKGGACQFYHNDPLATIAAYGSGETSPVVPSTRNCRIACERAEGSASWSCEKAAFDHACGR